MEIAFVNLGFARCSTFNSLLTGVGVDCVCAYLFILRWGLGCAGAAYVQIAVKATVGQLLGNLGGRCYLSLATRIWQKSRHVQERSLAGRKETDKTPSTQAPAFADCRHALHLH